MAFSLASLLTAGAGGYQQGQAQGYSRLAALAKARQAQQDADALVAYHEGMIKNGQDRNANTSDYNDARVKTAGQLAQLASLKATGGLDANGNYVRGSLANADMNANTRQLGAFAHNQDFLQANPSAATAFGVPEGMTLNAGPVALAKLNASAASAARTQATADKAAAETAEIAPNAVSSRGVNTSRRALNAALSGAATGNLAVHQFSAQQQAQVNLRKLQLQKQGLDEAHADRQATQEIQRGQLAVSQGRLALSGQEYANPVSGRTGGAGGHGGGVLPNGLTPSQNIALENQAHNNERAAAMLNDSITAGVAGDGKTPLTPGQIATRRHLVQSYQDNNASINRKLSTVAPAAVHPISGVGGAVRGVLPPGASLGALPEGVTALPALPHPSASQPRHPVTRQFQPRPNRNGSAVLTPAQIKSLPTSQLFDYLAKRHK